MSKKVANVHPFFGETTILFPVLLLVGMEIGRAHV